VGTPHLGFGYRRCVAAVNLKGPNRPELTDERGDMEATIQCGDPAWPGKEWPDLRAATSHDEPFEKDPVQTAWGRGK
jgi:hypothetical protein